MFWQAVSRLAIMLSLMAKSFLITKLIIMVTVLPCYESLTVSLVLLQFARLVRPTGTSLKDVWS